MPTGSNRLFSPLCVSSEELRIQKGPAHSSSWVISHCLVIGYPQPPLGGGEGGIIALVTALASQDLPELGMRGAVTSGPKTNSGLCQQGGEGLRAGPPSESTKAGSFYSGDANTCLETSVGVYSFMQLSFFGRGEKEEKSASEESNGHTFLGQSA